MPLGALWRNPACRGLEKVFLTGPAEQCQAVAGFRLQVFHQFHVVGLLIGSRRMGTAYQDPRHQSKDTGYPTVHEGQSPRTSTVLRSGSNPSRAASRPSVRSMPGSWISAADSHLRQIRNWPVCSVSGSAQPM